MSQIPLPFPRPSEPPSTWALLGLWIVGEAPEWTARALVEADRHRCRVNAASRPS